MSEFNDKEAAALTALQKGIPLAERPFAQLGRDIGLAEGEVVEIARRVLGTGQARRFGAVFDARRLGYRSALCAMDVPRARLAEIAARVAAARGVTHAYERGWPEALPRELPGGPGDRRWPNLWFTLATPAAGFAAEAERLRAACQPYAIHTLPALRRFKIDVVFDLRTRDRDERVETGGKPDRDAPPAALDARDIAVIRLLDGHVPPQEDLFTPVAAEVGMDTGALLARLREWQANGVMRRFALLLRHREMGFRANGMCCWDLPDGALAEAGRRLAACPDVTHCYERARMDIFPFRLYAMIHTPEWERTRQLFERLSQTIGARDGQVLLSLTEFKKTSMQFFS